MSLEHNKFSSLVKKTARGGLILILGQLISTLISSIGTIYIARILGASSFGIVSIAKVPINLCSLFVNVGLTIPITKYLASLRHERQTDQLKTYIIAGYLINVLIGGALTAIIFTLAGYISRNIYQIPELEPLIKILSVMTFAHALIISNYAVIEGFERMRLRSYIKILYSIIKSLVGPFLVALGFGAFGASLGISLPYIFAALVGSIFVFIIYRSIKKTTQSISYFKAMKEILRYGYPIYISNILGVGISQVFLFMLPFYASAESIGNLNAALNFNILVNFFVLPVLTALFPLFSKITKVEELEFLYNNVSKYISLVVLPIIIALITYADPLITFILTKSYSEANIYLQIAMIGQLTIIFGGSIITNILNSQNLTRINLNGNLLYSTIGLGIGLILIPRFGVIGYLLSELISSRLALFYRIFWVRKNLNLNIKWSFQFKAVISIIFTYLAGFGLSQILDLDSFYGIALGGITQFLVYITSIITLKLVNKDDFENIRSLFEGNSPISKIILKILNFLDNIITTIS